VLVKYENGDRFEAVCGGLSITSGKGSDGDTSRDNMFPPDMLATATAICIGIYIVRHCRNHNLSCEGLAIEVNRETAEAPARTTRIQAKVHIPSELSEKDREAILRVADRCHITQSVRRGLEVVCSVE
jgi:uncharacterized OsmC-like protein